MIVAVAANNTHTSIWIAYAKLVKASLLTTRLINEVVQIRDSH